jgi:hypothetical protein
MPDVRLIDANALRKDIHTSYSDDLGILEHIDNAPTIDEQPVKHGTWERTDMFVKCSECGVELLDDAFFGIHVFNDGYMPFCPNCGSYNGGE